MSADFGFEVAAVDSAAAGFDLQSTVAGEGARATRHYLAPNCSRTPALARMGGPTVSTGVRPTS